MHEILQKKPKSMQRPISKFLHRPLLCLLFPALVATACTTTGAPPAEGSAEITEEESQAIQSAAEAASLAEKARTHFQERSDRGELDQAIAAWEKALELLEESRSSEIHPVAESLSRAYYFRARYHHFLAAMPPKEKILDDSRRGVEYALLAIGAVAPETARTLSAGPSAQLDPALLDALSPENAPALLHYAQNLRLHAETTSLSATLEAEPAVEAIMAYLLEHHPEIGHGAPLRYFGERWITRPFHRRPDESARAYEQALEIAPEFLLTRVLRAANLAASTGDRALFEADLQIVLDADPQALPDAAAENFFAQVLARSLQAQTESLFE